MAELVLPSCVWPDSDSPMSSLRQTPGVCEHAEIAELTFLQDLSSLSVKSEARTWSLGVTLRSRWTVAIAHEAVSVWNFGHRSDVIFAGPRLLNRPKPPGVREDQVPLGAVHCFQTR